MFSVWPVAIMFRLPFEKHCPIMVLVDRPTEHVHRENLQEVSDALKSAWSNMSVQRCGAFLNPDYRKMCIFEFLFQRARIPAFDIKI